MTWWVSVIAGVVLAIAWDMWTSDSKVGKVVAFLIAVPSAIVLYVFIEQQGPLSLKDIVGIGVLFGGYMLWQIRTVLIEIRDVLKTANRAADNGSTSSQ